MLFYVFTDSCKYVVVQNPEDSSIGIAACGPHDEFCLDQGIAIALLRWQMQAPVDLNTTPWCPQTEYIGSMEVDRNTLWSTAQGYNSPEFELARTRPADRLELLQQYVRFSWE